MPSWGQYTMIKTIVPLPKNLNDSLNQIAQVTGRSQAELIREAIEQYLQRQGRSLPRSVGMGSSNMGNLSERDEELLWQQDKAS